MKQIITIFTIIFVLSFAASAQRNIYPVSGIKIDYMPMIGDTSHYFCKVQVTVQDTTHISKVYVDMGSQRGLSDIFQKQFIYDEAGSFPDNTSYRRTGNKITLGLGQFEKMAHFYGTVKVEKSDNSLTDAITFSR